MTIRKSVVTFYQIKYMKTLLTLSALIYLLISCDKQEYPHEIDFRKITFPVNNSTLIDSIQIKDFIAKNTFDDIICKTDKKKYKFGEKVMLIIKNQSNDTLYFFPSETEGARFYYGFSLLSDPVKESYKDQLISQDPALVGSLTKSDPTYINLHFAGVDKFTAQDLGLNAFEKPLFPDKEMQFSVTMPNRIGHYQFSIRNYFHTPNSYGIWSVNNFLVSNNFLIINE